MIISPFTPLFFHPSTDRYDIESDYIQKFSPSDRIFVQIISEQWESTPNVYIKNVTNGSSDKIHLNQWNINQSQTIYFHSITGLDNGFYTIIINDFQSNIFKITDDDVELSETTLIQYSMKGNNQRNDCAFWIDNMQYFFDFRAPGGFKDENWSFGVSNEQFVTQDEDIIELYSHEYSLHTFTLGNAMGCPVWFAELLNRVLCCNYVYFDAVRYARKEGNVPEFNQKIEGLKSFIFNQMLQKVITINPVLEWTNQVSMRRTQADKYRIITTDDNMRSIKQGQEERILTVVLGKLYIKKIDVVIGGIAGYRYDCRIILDNAIPDDVMFYIPVINKKTGIIRKIEFNVIFERENYDDKSFILLDEDIALTALDTLLFSKTKWDYNNYNVTWDGNYVDILPEPN